MVEYMETEEFIVDFFNKNRRALHAVFDSYFEQLYVFSYKLTDNEQEAEDIAIKSITNLFSRSDSFVELSNISAFLYRSARNASIDYLRKVKSRPTQSQERFYQLVDQDMNLENAQIHGRQMKELYTGLGKLPERCREVLELIYLEGLKYHEVADRLGISINSVKTQRRIGIQKLQTYLSDKNLIALLLFQAAALHCSN